MKYFILEPLLAIINFGLLYLVFNYNYNILLELFTIFLIFFITIFMIRSLILRYRKHLKLATDWFGNKI
jgi:hypothetical protein